MCVKHGAGKSLVTAKVSLENEQHVTGRVLSRGLGYLLEEIEYWDAYSVC